MFPFAQIAETLCLLCGTLLVGKEIEKHWHWFIIYMLLVSIGDWLGWWMSGVGLQNQLLYNIITVLEAVFMAYFFSSIFPSKKTGRYMAFIGFACFSLLFVSELINNGIHKYASDSQIFLCVWLILVALGYFYFLMKDDNYVPLHTHPEFWFVTGVLLFYMGSIGTNLFFTYFYQINIVNFRTIIFTFLNIILYGCWSYAFICKYRKRILS